MPFIIFGVVCKKIISGINNLCQLWGTLHFFKIKIEVFKYWLGWSNMTHIPLLFCKRVEPLQSIYMCWPTKPRRVGPAHWTSLVTREGDTTLGLEFFSSPCTFCSRPAAVSIMPLRKLTNASVNVCVSQHTLRNLRHASLKFCVS